MNGKLTKASLIALAIFIVSDIARAARPEINCQCRNANGEMRDLGTIECITIGSTQYK